MYASNYLRQDTSIFITVMRVVDPPLFGDNIK